MSILSTSNSYPTLDFVRIYQWFVGTLGSAISPLRCVLNTCSNLSCWREERSFSNSHIWLYSLCIVCISLSRSSCILGYACSRHELLNLSFYVPFFFKKYDTVLWCFFFLISFFAFFVVCSWCTLKVWINVTYLKLQTRTNQPATQQYPCISWIVSFVSPRSVAFQREAGSRKSF